MLLRSIRLRNLLSFKDASLELGPLNVLIGANASGKSNFIEAISLLQALPGGRGLSGVISAGGGIREWIWKGAGTTEKSAQIECVLNPLRGPMPIRYFLGLAEEGQIPTVVEERLENEKPFAGKLNPYSYAHVQWGRGALNVVTSDEGGKEKRTLRQMEFAPSQSVLGELRDPLQFPEITHFAKQFDSIRLCREWNMGRKGAPRLPQATDLRNDLLEETAENLVLVLNRMEADGSLSNVEAYLARFYERFDRLMPRIEGGTVQLYIREKGLSTAIPATRLSDGTLRFLCMLAVLCHPSPPPLVCIEEPELGMHPDALSLVAEGLVEASERMQLIVTTHSEALIDALSDRPEAVVVCEYEPDKGTQFRRLDKEELAVWLEDYTLGDLWRKGEIGGKKW